MSPRSINEKRKEVERLRQAHLFAEALTLCDEIISIDDQCYMAYSDRSRVFRDMGDYARAFVDIEILKSLEPESPGPYYTSAEWNLEIGENAKAMTDANFMIEAGDGYFLDVAYFLRSIALFGLGNRAAAIEDCLRLPADFKYAIRTPWLAWKVLSRDDLHSIFSS